MIDILDGQIELVGMAVGDTTIFGAAIGEHPVEWQPMLRVKRQHTIVQQSAVVTGVFSAYNLAKPTFAYVSMKVC